MLACGGARPRRSAGQLDPLGEPAQAAPLEHYPVPVGARVVTATRPAPEGPVRMKGRSRGESAASGIGAEEGSAAAWQKVLVDGQETLKRAQRVFRHLPSAPRCKLCQNPFRGVGGRVMGLAGFKPSRKNPNLCARCCDSLPPGGLELDIAVLFADVRGSTALCERVGATVFANLLNRFYRTATDVLVNHDAIIDKLVGDEVMALFIPGIAGKDYRRRAAVAAVDLIRALSTETT